MTQYDKKNKIKKNMTINVIYTHNVEARASWRFQRVGAKASEHRLVYPHVEMSVRLAMVRCLITLHALIN